MKKTILPVVAVVALMTMSFTTNTNKIQLVKTENGIYLSNANLLSTEDLQDIEKISAVGVKKTFIFHTKVNKDKVQETVVASEGTQIISSYQQEKLDEILTKY